MSLYSNRRSCQHGCQLKLTRAGFTLLELMVVVAVVAILSAIAAPNWLRFLDTQRLISAQNLVYQGIQQAQIKAQQNHAEWQFSIRDTNNVLEWSVHSNSVPSSISNWNTIANVPIQMDSETTLQIVSSSDSIRTVRFNHKGSVVSRLGRVTLSSKRFPQVKRCVYVSTILGALRQSKAQSKARNGDFCY